jgi:hypothetical protein
LSGVAAEGGTAVAIGSRQPQRVLGGLVSGNYFNVLGIRAQVGRTFAPDEDAAPGAHPVVVLSHALWTEHFGADPGVIGTRVAINGQPFTIIGVAPHRFTGAAFATDPYQLWMPMAMQGAAMPGRAGLLTNASQGWLRVVGRLRDGVTTVEADAEARVIARQASAPPTNAEPAKSARVLPMRGGLLPWEQDSLAPVFGLVSIVPVLVLLGVRERRERPDGTTQPPTRVTLTCGGHQPARRLVATRRRIAGHRAAGRPRRFRGLAGPVRHRRPLGDALGGRALLALTAHRRGHRHRRQAVLLRPAPAFTATRFEVLPVLKDEGVMSTVARSCPAARRLVVAQVACR